MIPNWPELLENPIPLPQEISAARANCFNGVQIFWREAERLGFVGPEEFVVYLNSKFTQIMDFGVVPWAGDVEVIWSRTSNVVPIGAIRVADLVAEREGYPFGLVIEHAFVVLENGLCFQKRDPTEDGPYELVSRGEALSAYLGRPGFEVTQHRRA